MYIVYFNDLTKILNRLTFLRMYSTSKIVTRPATALSSSLSIDPALEGRFPDQLCSFFVIDGADDDVISPDDVKRLFEASQLTVSPTVDIPLPIVCKSKIPYFWI